MVSGRTVYTLYIILVYSITTEEFALYKYLSIIIIIIIIIVSAQNIPKPTILQMILAITFFTANFFESI